MEENLGFVSGRTGLDVDDESVVYVSEVELQR